MDEKRGGKKLKKGKISAAWMRERQFVARIFWEQKYGMNARKRFFCGQKGAQENERKVVLYAAFGHLRCAHFFNQRVRVVVTNELLQIDL